MGYPPPPPPPLSVTVASLAPADEDDWRALWAGYCAYNQASVPEEVTADVWRRVLTQGDSTRGMIARDQLGRAVGLLHYVLHPNTWGTVPVCYLEDLFTAPDVRGRGVGRTLIETLVARAREAGWSRVYWHTDEGNHVARALYDRVTGGRDKLVRYVISLSPTRTVA